MTIKVAGIYNNSEGEWVANLRNCLVGAESLLSRKAFLRKLAYNSLGYEGRIQNQTIYYK